MGCPGGGAITIDGSLAHNLNALIRTAWRDGVNLCGVGYRDRRQQIRLRVQNCGSSDYAVWHKPSGSCSPPTAVPGTSMHERPGIPPGGVIDSAVTSIAWPRPPGDLPARPTEPWPATELMPPGLFPTTVD